MNRENLLGMKLEEVTEILDLENVEYEITYITGKKDEDILTQKRIVNIKEESNKLKLIVSYFSPSL